MLQIKVFGTTPPCANCKRAEREARKAAAKFSYSIDQGQLAELNTSYMALLDVDNLPPEAAYGSAPHKC